MTISVWNNKSNTAITNYQIIFSIIIGLLFSFSSQIVCAQSTSASAAADKGGQVVDIDWKKYTFNQIAVLPREERGIVLKKMGAADPMLLEDYNDFNLEAANQKRLELDQRLLLANQKWLELDQRLLLANQNNARKLQVEQAANQKWLELDQKLLLKMDQVVARWMPLKETDKRFLEQLSKWPPPNPLAEKLLRIAKFVDSAPR
jgi:hypothetical protein